MYLKKLFLVILSLAAGLLHASEASRALVARQLTGNPISSVPGPAHVLQREYARHSRAQAAQSAAPDWRSLPGPALESIVDHLDSDNAEDVKTFFATRGVCRSWRNACNQHKDSPAFDKALSFNHALFLDIIKKIRAGNDLNAPPPQKVMPPSPFVYQSTHLFRNYPEPLRAQICRLLFFVDDLVSRKGAKPDDGSYLFVEQCVRGSKIIINMFAKTYGLQELKCLYDAARSHVWWGTNDRRYQTDCCFNWRPFDEMVIKQVCDYIEQKIAELEARQAPLNWKQRLYGFINRHYTAPIADGRWQNVRGRVIEPILLYTVEAWLVAGCVVWLHSAPVD